MTGVNRGAPLQWARAVARHDSAGAGTRGAAVARYRRRAVLAPKTGGLQGGRNAFRRRYLDQRHVGEAPRIRVSPSSRAQNAGAWVEEAATWAGAAES